MMIVKNVPEQRQNLVLLWDVAVTAQLSGQVKAVSIIGRTAHVPAEQGAVVWLVISQAS